MQLSLEQQIRYNIFMAFLQSNKPCENLDGLLEEIDKIADFILSEKQ